MKKAVQTLVLTAICLLSISVQAQRLRNFSGDQNNYVNELRAFYKEDKNIEKDKDAVKDYEALLLSYDTCFSQLQGHEKKRIIDMSNTMMQMRFRAKPGFYDFIKAQIDFKSSSQSDESFNQWLQGLELVLGTKKTQSFLNVLSSTSDLLNGGFMYDSRTTSWSSSSTDFTFRTDKTLMVIFDTPMNLTVSSKLDSNTIFGTKGVYYPAEERWEGHGGKVYWIRTDLPENKCWAELRNYEANTKFSKFTADSVVFVYTQYFKRPLLGKLEEDLGTSRSPEQYAYPRFKSYEKDFVIENIFPDINYSGSFIMQGAKFIASGADGEYVSIIINHKKKPLMKASAKNFYITTDRISSESVILTVYMGEDSIFNAGLGFKYLNESKEVSIVNDENRNYYSPFEDSYHKMDIYCNALYWKMGNEVVDFSSLRGSSQSSASFESQNYFSENRYREIMGIDQISPVERVRTYCNSRKITSFFIDEFANYIKMDITQAKLMIHTLARYGFVSVNTQDGFVYVKDKLLSFSRSKAKAVDYDAVNLSSLVSGTSNAILDLKTNDLNLYGVRQFVLSDTQMIVIQPTKGELVVKEDRDMAFDGRVIAGRFDMNARKCYFSYKNFKIDMPTVDSLRFYVASFENKDKLMKVRTPLRNLKGELFIDKKDNKASLKKFEEYPIFNSIEYSYAFYDEPYIQGGVYDPKRFYYRLDPFTIRKLTKFETDSLVFLGMLNSANIFPSINEPLKVQPDYSLGFVMKTPQTGLPMYGGKGHYFETIDLSFNGFLGRGRIDYLGAQTVSKNIVFMPDSVHAITDTFFVKEQLASAGKPEMPDVKVGKATERWYPYENKMYLYQDKDPFSMYKNEVAMHGHLLLTPAGMSGGGTSHIGEGSLVADNFNFKQTNMSSDSSEFRLQAVGFDGLSFYARNMKSKVDFKTRKGEFLSKKEMERVVLPTMQYTAYVDMFTWEMDKSELGLAYTKSKPAIGVEKMELKALLKTTMPGALFVSTHPNQDSLSFNSVKTNFKYKENILNSEQVYLIRVADAAIAPGSKKLNISAQAKMDAIPNSTILADTALQYHTFYNANVSILGKKSYLASGYIDYTDENKTKQKIFLAKIQPNSSLVTTAQGTVTDTNRFMLSPVFGFKGEVIVNAKEVHYTFDGGVQLKHKCLRPEETLAWTRFKSSIDPDSIYIPIAEVPTEFSGARATASILYNKQNYQPYAAFLTQDKDVDNGIISASGFLIFNKKKSEYQIAKLPKLQQPEEESGNMLNLNQITCDVKADGRLNFGFSQDFIKMLTYGSMKVNNVKNQTETNITFGLDFPFVDKAVEFMAHNISDDMSAEMMNLENKNFLRVFKEYTGSKGEEYANDINLSGEIKRFPSELNYTLLLDNVRLKFNEDPRIGYTYSGNIGLWKVANKQQYKQMRGGIQIRKYKGTNTLNVYIEVSPDEWYFFSYEEKGNNSKMRAYSNMGEFNDFIRTIPAQDMRKEDSKTKKVYTWGLAVPIAKDNFIRTIQGLKGEGEDDDDDDEEEVEEVEEIEEVAPEKKPATVTPKADNKKDTSEDEEVEEEILDEE